MQTEAVTELADLYAHRPRETGSMVRPIPRRPNTPTPDLWGRAQPLGVSRSHTDLPEMLETTEDGEKRGEASLSQ